MTETILIRNLPEGTKARLAARAGLHHRSMEAEVREIIGDALVHEPVTLVDLLAMPGGANIDFEPERLGAVGRDVEF